MPSSTFTIIVLIAFAAAVGAGVLMTDWSSARSDQNTRAVLLGAVPFVVGAALMFALRHWLGWLQRPLAYVVCFGAVWTVSMVVLTGVKGRASRPSALMTAAVLQAAMVCGVLWLGD